MINSEKSENGGRCAKRRRAKREVGVQNGWCAKRGCAKTECAKMEVKKKRVRKMW